MHASLDGGQSWLALTNGLPTAPIDDLVIHPREADLVAGTHGRSIYILDIGPLQELTDEILQRDAHLFTVKAATLFMVDTTRNKGASGARRFTAPNPYSELGVEGDSSGMAPPGATIYYYLKSAAAAPPRLTVRDNTGTIVRELTGPADAGLNRVLWDLRRSSLPPGIPWRQVGGNDSRRLAKTEEQRRPGPLVPAGEYRLTLEVDGRTLTQPLRVVPDESATR